MNVVKSERKPRRNIQYKDLASAVSRIDNLEFLADLIPKTTTFREYKEKKAKTARPNVRLSSGQTTLDNSRPLPSRPADVMTSPEVRIPQGRATSGDRADEFAFQDVPIHLPRTNGEPIFEHYVANGNPSRDVSEDVEMG
ncbi:MAG: hypothetical protein Q9196_002558 [Gyalolechia fulgens]